jgi:hypothetical protein
MSDIHTQFRSRIEAAKSKRSELIAGWQENVSYRLGQPFESTSDRDRVAVTLDWSQTKAKQAQLFSQVPEVRLTPKHPAFAAAVPVFAKVLNETLTKAKVGTVMDEVLPDCINAAGVGAAIVGYEARTEPVEVPAIDLSGLDPMVAMSLMQSGQVPMETVERVVDSRFTVTHISPEDLLWPVEFTGSDADDGPWIGRSGRMTRATAKHAFDLTDAQLELAAGSDQSAHDRLVPENALRTEDEVVSFEEVYYWRHLFHPEEKHFKAIQRVVYVTGIDEPVIDEPWKGQQFDEEAGYVGACKFPIRVLTLTHISGQFIPPSDSAIARPQVNELIKSRSQMIQQRDHSVPIRWMDINRIDPAIQELLQQGDWQGFIPTNGSGASAIGEVARASYPREDFEFDRVAKADIQEAWQVGPNQMGAMHSGERSASEAQIVQANFQTRIGYERARVVAFYVGIAEVTAGLLALYGDFDLPSIGQDGAQQLQSWDRTRIYGEVVYDGRPDSSVLRDGNRRLQRLIQTYNFAAPSGYVEVEPILKEIIALSGLDPAIVRAPKGKAPEPLNVSIRNAEDLRDPVMLALLMATGQAPSPQHLEAAKALLAAAPLPAGMAAGAPGPPAEAPGPTPLEPPVGSEPAFQMAPRINHRSDGSEL